MNAFLKHLGSCLKTALFCGPRDLVEKADFRALCSGILVTWLVGLGRWWEDPRAGLWQHTGAGSLLYTVGLALLLWLLLWPLRPANWTPVKVWLFVLLASPPGLLYAIPVRHGIDVETGREVRQWFLCVVSLWRVALLWFYLGRWFDLKGVARFVATTLPLALIVVILTALNLEKVVFDFMRGTPPELQTVDDTAYQLLWLLSLLSVLVSVPLLLLYLWEVYEVWVRRKGRNRTEAAAAEIGDGAKSD